METRVIVVRGRSDIYYQGNIDGALGELGNEWEVVSANTVMICAQESKHLVSEPDKFSILLVTTILVKRNSAQHPAGG